MLVLTLLAGCQHGMPARVVERVPQPRVDESKPVAPPEQLPDTIPTRMVRPAPPVASPSEGNVAAKPDDPKWAQFTNPPKIAEVKPVSFEKDSSPPQPIVEIKAEAKHPVVAAMECMLDDRHEDALRHLQKYDPRTREFLQRVLPTLSLVARNNQLGPADVAALNEQFTSVKVYLQQLSDFSLSRMQFCESIKGFAVYKPLPADHEFVAASGDRPGELVQLYVELRNFASEPKGGLFETLLSSQLEIQDAAGGKVWSHRFRTEDLKIVSQSRLGESYQSFSFAVPPGLQPGTYTLWVTMADETRPGSPRVARSSLPIRIVSPKN